MKTADTQANTVIMIKPTRRVSRMASKLLAPKAWPVRMVMQKAKLSGNINSNDVTESAI